MTGYRMVSTYIFWGVKIAGKIALLLITALGIALFGVVSASSRPHEDFLMNLSTVFHAILAGSKDGQTLQ